MFGKKSSVTSNPALTVKVQTIPDDFYGGANPVIKFKKIEKEIVLDSKPTLTASEKQLLDQSTTAGSGNSFSIINLFSSRKFALIFLVGLFVLIAAGAGIYYYLHLRPEQNQALPPAPELEIPSSTPTQINTPTTTTEVLIPTTTQIITTTVTEAPIDFPSNLMGDSPDLDKDNITDIAEDLFGTDPSKPDSDEDTHTDGHELFYLYNPAGQEPMRLIDSGYVKEYKNSTFGYTVYYPVNWAVGSVDVDSRQVLFSTIGGENIEIRSFDKNGNQSFTDWLAQWAPGQNIENLNSFQTRFFESGYSRADNLIYYFQDANHIYVMLYHTTDSNAVNYRSIMVIMARSFKSVDFVPPTTATATGTYPAELPDLINPGS